MCDSNIVVLGGNIAECGCSIDPRTHIHTLVNGMLGCFGPLGPPEGDTRKPWVDTERREVKHIVNMECTCENTKSHVHVTTIGKQGETGFRGPERGCQKMLVCSKQSDVTNRRYTIVIRNCKWCTNKNPHDHAVFEGLQGPQGECWS